MNRKGRNIVNAKQIVFVLSKRLKLESTNDLVRNWMLTRYRKWIINDYANVIPLLTVEQYTHLMNEPAPIWLKEVFTRSSNEVKPYYINLYDNELVVIEQKLVEVLHSCLGTQMEANLNMYSVQQMLDKWEQDHATMLVNGKPLLRTSRQALNHIFSIGTHTFYAFMPHEELRKELHNESVMMGHCIGQFQDEQTLRGGYAEQFVNQINEQESDIYSLRDSNNFAHVTLDVKYGVIQQIKGKQNQPPVKKYVSSVIAFLNYLKLGEQDCDDLARMGIGYEYGSFQAIEDISDKEKLFYMLYRTPSLMYRVEKESYHPMYTWAVLLADKKNIEWLAKEHIQKKHKDFSNGMRPRKCELVDPEIPIPNAFNWMKRLGQNLATRMGGDNVCFALHSKKEGMVFEKESLEASWDITSRKSALNTLQSLYAHGHLSSFTPRIDKPLMTARGVLAFDIVRLIHLARACCYCEYITEQEALSYCIDFTFIAQDCFESLEDYYDSYLYGREVWGEIDDEVKEEVTQVILETVPFTTKIDLPWKMPLDFCEKSKKQILLKYLIGKKYKPKENLKYYSQLGHYYTRQNDYNRALEYFTYAYTKFNDIDMQREVANSLYMINEDKRALEIINDVLRKEPNHVEALRTKASIFEFDFKHDMAFSLQKRAAYLAQNYYEFRVLGDTCYDCSFYDEAVYYYRLSMKLDTEKKNDRKKIKFRIVESLYNNSKFKESEKAARNFLKTEGYDVSIDVIMALCWTKEGRILDAYNHYVEITKRDDIEEDAMKTVKKNIELMAGREEVAHLNLPIVE